MAWQSAAPSRRVGARRDLWAARVAGRIRMALRWSACALLAASAWCATSLFVFPPTASHAALPAQDVADLNHADVPRDVQYLPLDAPPGMSQAVVVRNEPLVHTRQLLPLDRDGNIVGPNSLDDQIRQTLANLEAVLGSAGSGLNQLVRVNVCAIEPPTVERVRELLSQRLDASVRPALAAVLTPLPHHQALVAIDAVAVSSVTSETVSLIRCETVAGAAGCADAAVLPPGGVAFLSGVPGEGGLTHSAIDQSTATLRRTLVMLQLAPSDVVQLKVFLRPALAADDVRRQLQATFGDQLLPPVVFVEWIAQAPVEIELVAHLPPADTAAPRVVYLDPPDVRPLPTFSRVALVHSDRLIYVSGLFAREAGRGEAQATDLFEQLQTVLDQTGSDMQHLAKGTYYVSDDDGGRGFDRVRLRQFDPKRPPAASKVMVYGVGQTGRNVTMDMIAVPHD